MTAPLVELNHADVSLQGSRILTGINWRLFPGQHWAVLGGNGSGKSTFLKLVRGEIWPEPGRDVRIYRLGDGEQRTAVGIKEHMPLVSPEAQDRYLQIEWTHRVQEVIYSGFAGTDYLFRKPAATPRAIASDLIRLLGVEDLLKRNVQELSTGELRRVLIARALVSRPKVLLLDEVCDGLDARARRKLLGTLESIARSGTQLIFTTHRDDELIPSLTHTLVLNQGRITFQGQRDESGTGAPHSMTLRDNECALEFAAASWCAALPCRFGIASKSVLIRMERTSVYLNRAPV